MTALEAPDRIVRTTLGQDVPSIEYGIYVLAYLGRIVYVGKTRRGVHERLRAHITDQRSMLGAWLTLNRDWSNIRLDILVPPDDKDRVWLNNTEVACINEFSPLLNTQIG